jgi:phosphoribosyl-AMP cyclohydrolase
MSAVSEQTLELEGRVRFGADGLVAAVVQQHDTREVLMLAWMDEAALRETVTTRRGTYFSRSRQERWRKGDTSGHVQHVVRVSYDCDGDTVLLEVDQTGPACHTGTRTCFDGRVLLDAVDGAVPGPGEVPGPDAVPGEGTGA